MSRPVGLSDGSCDIPFGWCSGSGVLQMPQLRRSTGAGKPGHRRREASPLADSCRLFIDVIDYERAVANEASSGYKALKGMLDQACCDSVAVQAISVASLPSSKHGTE